MNAANQVLHVPAANQVRLSMTIRIGDGLPATAWTITGPFESINQLLSDRPLRRPNRNRPARPAVSSRMLKKLAVQNPPAPEWFETEEECPF